MNEQLTKPVDGERSGHGAPKGVYARTEFVEPLPGYAYADPQQWPDSRLSERLAELTHWKEVVKNPDPERLRDIQAQISGIAFEQMERYAERPHPAHPEDAVPTEKSDDDDDTSGTGGAEVIPELPSGGGTAVAVQEKGKDEVVPVSE